MTPDKVREVVALYRTMFAELIDGRSHKCSTDGTPDEHRALLHCWAMLDELEQFTREGRMEKAFRWLGFIQGCLWTCGVYSLDELKDHNKP
jgi:hypothetical protein